MIEPEKTITARAAGGARIQRDGGGTVLASPVVPRLAGVGVEQRAARTVAALSERAPVDLVVCRPWWMRLEGGALALPEGCRSARVAARVDPLPGEMIVRRAALGAPRSRVVATIASIVGRLGPRAGTGARASAAEGERFHAFRLAAAGAIPRGAMRKTIDLDDLESEVARAIAELARRAGDSAVASFYGELTERLAALERALVPRFDRAYVGSRADAEWLSVRMPRVDVQVLPNVVDLPSNLVDLSRRRASGPIRFLFIGALAYYPNIDALRTLLDGIVPRLRSVRPHAFELHVVGRGAPRWLEARLRATPEVVFHGAVPSIAPLYDQADAVLVPLAAGGGTRIKLLEAFAHGVPVITTTTGAFGLDVDGRHLIIADGADALAQACAAFIDAPDRAPMIAAARAFVAEHHHPHVFAEALR